MIKDSDFTIMESDSEEFFAFKLNTGDYEGVIFRFGKVSGKESKIVTRQDPTDAKIDFEYVALVPNEKNTLEELDKDEKFGIIAGQILKHVLETSIGLDRMFLAVFSNSLTEETLENNTTRTVLKLPAVLAPTKAAVFPLLKKDGLPEVARQIIEDLKWDFNVFYDEKDAVGKRYRRQDAAGTPFCITVDHETLENNTVTIRHRDTMKQQRVNISELKKIINQEVDAKNWLTNM